jgi:hypothetical protein
VLERAVHGGVAVRSLLVAVAVGGALAGGCGKGSLDTDPPPPPPTPTPVTFELRNDGIATVYLRQGCLVDYTITSLADPVHVIQRPWSCGCDCALASCPVCGACFEGSREVAIGAALTDQWWTVDIISVPRLNGVACERKEALPDGPYRIDVPVYASDADAIAQTNALTALQSFVLPAPRDSVTVQVGVSP